MIASTILLPLPLLPLPKRVRNDEILGHAAVWFGDQLQRLDQRNFDVFFLDQSRECLRRDFLEVGEGERAFPCGEGFGDGDGVGGVEGGESQKLAVPFFSGGEQLCGDGVDRGQAVEGQRYALELCECLGGVGVEIRQAIEGERRAFCIP